MDNYLRAFFIAFMFLITEKQCLKPLFSSSVRLRFNFILFLGNTNVLLKKHYVRQGWACIYSLVMQEQSNNNKIKCHFYTMSINSTSTCCSRDITLKRYVDIFKRISAHLHQKVLLVVKCIQSTCFVSYLHTLLKLDLYQIFSFIKVLILKRSK